jgi:basic membrane protein A and related proteins
MIKSKRVLAASLVAALSLTAAACGDDDETPAATDAPEATGSGGNRGARGPAELPNRRSRSDRSDHWQPSGESFNVGLTFDIGGRGDQSFNDSAAVGIDRAADELGITFTEAEPNADGSNRAELLQLQADGAPSSSASASCSRATSSPRPLENPDTNFAVIDDAMLDFDNGAVPLCDNCAGLTFAEEQGSFLVGAAAALNSRPAPSGSSAASAASA